MAALESGKELVASAVELGQAVMEESDDAFAIAEDAEKMDVIVAGDEVGREDDDDGLDDCIDEIRGFDERVDGGAARDGRADGVARHR